MFFVDERKSGSVVSFISVGVVLVIGLPVWWNTTKVYRATLPHAGIQQIANLQVYTLCQWEYMEAFFAYKFYTVYWVFKIFYF
jgi:hypothetical protein